MLAPHDAAKETSAMIRIVICQLVTVPVLQLVTRQALIQSNKVSLIG